MLAHTGIKGGTWSAYESGRSEPELDIVIKISTFFRVTVDELLKVDLSQEGNLIIEPGSLYKTKNSNLIGNVKGNLNAIKPNNIADKKALEEALKECKSKDAMIATQQRLIESLQLSQMLLQQQLHSLSPPSKAAE